jgi:O-antigen ligase
MMNMPRFQNIASSRVVQLGMLAYVVIAFFCNLAIYLSLTLSPRLQPQYWLGLLIILLIPLAALSFRRQRDVLHMPLSWWCALFLTITLVSYAVVPGGHIEQLKERIRDVLLLLALTSLFSVLRERLLMLRKFVLLATVFGALVDMISIFHNRFLLPKTVQFAARPAGLYINPNEAATALLLGMILSVTVLPRKWRMPYLAFVLVAVLATFSREAIIGWFVMTVLFALLKLIDWKRILLWAAALVLPSILILVVIVKYTLINVHVAWYYKQQLNRLVWFMHEGGHHNSVSVRLQLIKDSWNLFLKHPWIGNGIGSTEHWALPYSTHNMYLYYMTDYGFIGALLFPLLVLAVVIQARGEIRKVGYCLAVFMLFWGWFDHDIVRNYYSLFAFSLMAALAWLSSQEQAMATDLSGSQQPSVSSANPARN